MHLAVVMPKQKTLLEQVWPAIIAAAIVVIGVFIIPVHYPVRVSDGRILPSVVRPGDTATVLWTQDWRELCQISVTREFVGSDGFPKTALPYVLKPPAKTGISPYDGSVVIPDLPNGEAYYRSKIDPHCWIDTFWQRRYYTPDVPIMIVQKTPTGPR